MKETRREFLRQCARASGAGMAMIGSAAWLEACATRATANAAFPTAATGSGNAVGWSIVPAIIARIKAPAVPARDFSITSFGAVGDGKVDSSEAITRTIAACKAAGGGRIVVPAGNFVTGPVHLASRMELHVSAGATLSFVTQPARYLPLVLTRFEGVECYNYSPLIYAIDADDVAVTGTGTLDGCSDDTHWWDWKGGKDAKSGGANQIAARARLMQLSEDGAPVTNRKMGDGSFLRPCFVEFYRCNRVLVERVNIVRSPMWEIHPVLSNSVTVRNVTIMSHGPNNDGCDPESCRDVLIEGCTFDTGDDCIAIKSGRNADGRRINVPTEYVVVRNCTMRDGHGGVTVGSEISGGVRHVYVENCRMDSPQLDRALRLKTNAMRGGTLEHIYMRDVTIGQVSDSVLSIDFTYEEGANGPFSPVVRDIELLRVTSKRSKYGLYLKGFATAPIHDVRVLSSTFEKVSGKDVVENANEVVWRDSTVNGVRISS